MATESKASTLANSIVATLATSYAECFIDARNSGSNLAGFCVAARGASLSDAPEAQDIEAIVDAIALKLNWVGTGRERANKSDTRVIIATHASLPEGITAYKAATGMCGYHEAVKVARKIRKLGSASAAVAFLTNADKAKKKVDHDAGLTRALQSYWRAMRNSNRKDRLVRMEAVQACAASLKLTINTE